MKITAFSVIKNEQEFIGFSIMSILNYVDELVYYEGNSTDGTITIIEHIKNKYDKENKIKLFKNKDFKNLKTDYQLKFNQALKECTGDYIIYLHPDMVIQNPEIIRNSLKSNGIRYNVKMISIAGEKRDKIINSGRGNQWAIIYKNSLGLHFSGYYGAIEEDFYFKDITGDEHKPHCLLPYASYPILDTNIKIYHYCECKNYERRLDKMIKVLSVVNPNISKETILEIAHAHPRVTLENKKYMGIEYNFIPNRLKTQEVFLAYGNEFKRYYK